MIYIYALSLLFVFSDCIRRNAGAKRTGTGLLVVVILLQLCHLVLRTWTEGHLPIFTAYDFLFLFSFSLVLTALVMGRFRNSEFAVLLLGIVGFAVAVLNRFWFQAGDTPLGSGWYMVHGLLVLHITLANLSFAALTVAAVFAVMYLFLHRRLKRKKWNDTVRRLPSLELMDKYSYHAMLIGTPLLAVSVIVAVLSIIAENKWALLLDLKVWATVAALGVYIFYLVFKRYRNRSGLNMAKWTLIAYAFIILNFVVNTWSAFHHWAWG
ncbi:cytochrome c biogenesis protein CcsA [Paenibacillus sp. JX-17]|uniref:Cytochrome c biogenesis protein CcsA n=1 Tax=Paenibacillus lacisoli TaxID=3064525 RepID=A0ABT9CCD6_9BACL|nr:cytochrome c biogenesis protein CcsA [Paenibacillus sp. JX-17]MDO7906901.1 cytochrome c biogenesis protein CcsA [Paenibacillus sp. JX-17]